MSEDSVLIVKHPPISPESAALMQAALSAMLEAQDEYGEGYSTLEIQFRIPRIDKKPPDLFQVEVDAEFHTAAAATETFASAPPVLEFKAGDSRKGVALIRAARAAIIAASMAENRACAFLTYAFPVLDAAGKPAGILHVDVSKVETIAATKVGRNEPCPCGSGKKFKKCCAAVAISNESIAKEAADSIRWPNKKDA